MAGSHVPSTTQEKTTSDRATDGLVDELLAYYIDWRRDAAAVTSAYREWSAASGAEGPLRFAAYMAALDQEQSSADRYALVLKEVERALEFDNSASASAGER
ncbi:MAG: hypothetical protein JO368_04085 [Acidimicrobiales bacterium]|nr:hypothetical protein [Acidimicrobiales bacterium]